MLVVFGCPCARVAVNGAVVHVNYAVLRSIVNAVDDVVGGVGCGGT